MANPGPYPPMGGQMQPMGGPPMGPMGIPRPPLRQGTSRMVPVVVAAGLSVGVFCGLLFGLGTGKHAEPIKATNGPRASAESQIQTAQVNTGTKIPERPPIAPPAGSAAAAAAVGSAGSAGASAEPPTTGKLTLEIKPDNVAQVARISVDGKPITGLSTDVAFEPGVTRRTVKVLVQVPGYKDIERSLDVERDGESSLALDMKGIRPIAGGSAPTGDGASAPGVGGSAGSAAGANKSTAAPPPRPPTPPRPKGNGKGSGLIDI